MKRSIACFLGWLKATVAKFTGGRKLIIGVLGAHEGAVNDGERENNLPVDPAESLQTTVLLE
jgi:hypothetical protein